MENLETGMDYRKIKHKKYKPYITHQNQTKKII